jgi:intracellular sulfur oxidation DsrE/DsrF family protein
MSVVKPAEVNDLPDLSKDYKLLFEIVDFSRKNNVETAFKNENAMLLEAGRIINLHIASGIPADKLKVVFVIHGKAVDVLYNNKMYQEQYKIDNPNLALIKQMQDKGIKFIVCGQLMTWGGLKLSNLTEGIKEAYSAKTAVSNYQNQGYIYAKIHED